MNRREFTRRMRMAGAALPLGQTSEATIRPAMSKKPNIVIILSDAVGYGDLTCYGGVSVSTNAEAKPKAKEERFMPGEVDCPEPALELYDLVDDPGEAHNVVSKYPKTARSAAGKCCSRYMHSDCSPHMTTQSA